jgi:hypothetical protein
MRCKCRRCEASFILTPERQKFAYEVEKKYVLWVPRFCDQCQSKFLALSESARSYQDQWSESPSSLKSNRKFLQEWLVVLSAIEPYWGSAATCKYVERTLEELARQGKDA